MNSIMEHLVPIFFFALLCVATFAILVRTVNKAFGIRKNSSIQTSASETKFITTCGIEHPLFAPYTRSRILHQEESSKHVYKRNGEESICTISKSYTMQLKLFGMNIFRKTIIDGIVTYNLLRVFKLTNYSSSVIESTSSTQDKKIVSRCSLRSKTILSIPSFSSVIINEHEELKPIEENRHIPP